MSSRSPRSSPTVFLSSQTRCGENFFGKIRVGWILWNTGALATGIVISGVAFFLTIFCWQRGDTTYIRKWVESISIAMTIPAFKRSTIYGVFANRFAPVVPFVLLHNTLVNSCDIYLHRGLGFLLTDRSFFNPQVLTGICGSPKAFHGVCVPSGPSESLAIHGTSGYMLAARKREHRRQASRRHYNSPLPNPLAHQTPAGSPHRTNRTDATETSTR